MQPVVFVHKFAHLLVPRHLEAPYVDKSTQQRRPVSSLVQAVPLELDATAHTECVSPNLTNPKVIIPSKSYRSGRLSQTKIPRTCTPRFGYLCLYFVLMISASTSSCKKTKQASIRITQAPYSHQKPSKPPNKSKRKEPFQHTFPKRASQARKPIPKASTGPFKRFTGLEFQALYEKYRYSDVIYPKKRPYIRSHPKVDAIIQAIAEKRGYRLRPEATCRCTQKQTLRAWYKMKRAAKKEGFFRSDRAFVLMPHKGEW